MFDYVTTQSADIGQPLNLVVDAEGETIATAKDEETAIMIAAALNMTEREG